MSKLRPETIDSKDAAIPLRQGDGGDEALKNLVVKGVVN